MSYWFNTKGSGFRCNYGFVSEVLTLRVASGILPAMFFFLPEVLFVQTMF